MLLLLTALAIPATSGLSAQQELRAESDSDMTVLGSPPADLSGMTEGPDIEGFIAARSGDQLKIQNADGTGSIVRLSDGTQIKASKGILGLGRKSLDSRSLLNGLPVTVKTVEWAGHLVASQVKLRNTDLKTATMIRTGTSQGFAEQTAATEALRGRVGDIDKYNIKSTTNVNFDTGRYNLSPAAQSELCSAARQADAIDNALLLVVGYTDSTGSYETNQRLSEKRASRVVNYLQQECGWKPYRMLTPTGMAKADPLADNQSAYGRAQNRRVAVNILVSKGLDGL